MRKTQKPSERSQKSQKLREQALEQLRQTRAKLLKEHPLLMKKMSILAKRHAPQFEDESQEPKAPISADQSAGNEEVKLDQNKNRSTIEKYLELKSSKSPINGAIKAMLKKH